MRGSIAAVLAYLDKVDPAAANIARERYGCLTPWQKEPATYGRAVLTEGYRKCEQAVIEQCQDLLRRELECAAPDEEGFLDAAQNARPLIGFGMHTGTVAAASDWDADMEIKRVRPSHQDSYERQCHDSGVRRFLLDFANDEAVRRRLVEQRLERFIGVIYRPDTELLSHYAEASLSNQFDAFVWFDETSAVVPLGPEHAKPGVPDTYPFGV